jgi:hypothetical protein
MFGSGLLYGLDHISSIFIVKLYTYPQVINIFILSYKPQIKFPLSLTIKLSRKLSFYHSKNIA